jgi:hypothetical protein
MLKIKIPNIRPSLRHVLQLILVFYFFVHFLLPFFLHKIFGFTPLYNWGFNFKKCGDALGMLALVSIGAFFGSMLVIRFLPDTKAIKPLNVRFPYLFFYINLCFDLFYFFYFGGYQGVASLGPKEKWLAYLQYFSNNKLSFVLTDLIAGGGSWAKTLIYIISTTLMGSRGGIFFVYFSLVFLMSYYVWKKAYKKYIVMMLFITPFSFLAFNAATRVREVSGAQEEVIAPKVESYFKGNNNNNTGRIKLGRISFIEPAAIPLCKPLLTNESMDLFHLKFDILHQLGLTFNFFSPYKIIPRDAWSNQYYQAIFLGYPIENVPNNYFSINMGLQTYLILVTGNPYSATVLFILICTLYYFFSAWIFKLHQRAGIVFMFFLYDLLIFFDWTYFLTGLIKGFLTLFIFEICLYLQQKSRNNALPAEGA